MRLQRDEEAEIFMEEREPFWQRVFNRIWLWLVLSNIIFFAVYALWGWLDLSRIPTR